MSKSRSAVSAPKGQYTIDALAAEAGLPSRTVRHYQSEGLLPPPLRQGRKGLYDGSHLERLRVIAQLQDRGLNLRTIGDALHHVDRGGFSLQDWLGMEADLTTPWLDETPLVLDDSELEERLGEVPRGTRTALVRGGLLEARGRGASRRYLVPSPSLLDIALRLQEAGIDIETAVSAGYIMRRRLSRACTEVVDLVAKRIQKGYTKAQAPERVGAVLAELRTTGIDAVRVIFSQEIENALQESVSKGIIRPQTPKTGKRRRARRS